MNDTKSTNNSLSDLNNSASTSIVFIDTEEPEQNPLWGWSANLKRIVHSQFRIYWGDDPRPERYLDKR
jgi:hypothetical protein